MSKSPYRGAPRLFGTGPHWTEGSKRTADDAIEVVTDEFGRSEEEIAASRKAHDAVDIGRTRRRFVSPVETTDGVNPMGGEKRWR